MFHCKDYTFERQITCMALRIADQLDNYCGMACPLGMQRRYEPTVVAEAPVGYEQQPLRVAGTGRLQAAEVHCVPKCLPIANSVVIAVCHRHFSLPS